LVVKHHRIIKQNQESWRSPATGFNPVPCWVFYPSSRWSEIYRNPNSWLKLKHQCLDKILLNKKKQSVEIVVSCQLNLNICWSKIHNHPLQVHKKIGTLPSSVTRGTMAVHSKMSWRRRRRKQRETWKLWENHREIMVNHHEIIGKHRKMRIE
jgi:hypothetical protein